MFDIDVPGGVRLKESDFTIPGQEIIAPVDSPIGKIGLGIVSLPCFCSYCLRLNLLILFKIYNQKKMCKKNKKL